MFFYCMIYPSDINKLKSSRFTCFDAYVNGISFANTRKT